MAISAFEIFFSAFSNSPSFSRDHCGSTEYSILRSTKTELNRMFPCGLPSNPRVTRPGCIVCIVYSYLVEKPCVVCPGNAIQVICSSSRSTKGRKRSTSSSKLFSRFFFDTRMGLEISSCPSKFSECSLKSSFLLVLTPTNKAREVRLRIIRSTV